MPDFDQQYENWMLQQEAREQLTEIRLSQTEEDNERIIYSWDNNHQ